MMARTAGGWRLPSLRRRWVVPILALFLAFGVWAGGLAWFAFHISQPPPAMPAADGIVALTGGAGRVEAALRLAAEQPAAKLLISGIGGGTDLETLAQRAGVESGALAGRVTLGREAASTRGNALEARAWVMARGVRSLIVVTAAFHMPRALVELRRMLPDVTLFPYAPDIGGRRVSLRVLMVEYNKYLVALTGLSGLIPGRDQPRAGPTPG